MRNSVMPPITLNFQLSFQDVVSRFFSPRLESTPVLRSKPDSIDPGVRKRSSMAFVDPTTSATVKLWATMVPRHPTPSVPISTKLNCWWCRAPFSTSPIGCPLRYVPSSEPYRKLIGSTDLKTDYFETEGIFCSFPCVKAFILDSRSPRFGNSLALLSLLHLRMFGVRETIPTAPSWKLGIGYGGHLTPEEFRSSFGEKFEFVPTPNLRRPLALMTSSIFLERSSPVKN